MNSMIATLISCRFLAFALHFMINLAVYYNKIDMIQVTLPPLEEESGLAAC